MPDRNDHSALSPSEVALLRDVFEHAPFEFWVRDAEGRCIVQNAAARRWGIALGRPFDESDTPQEVLAAWRANNARAYAGELVQNEITYDVDGELRYYECVVAPIRTDERVLGILGFNIDQTERKRAEEALRQNERRLRETLRIGRMGYLDWDLVTNEIRWSPETYRLFGYDPEGAFTPTIEGTVGMVPPEDQPIVQARLDAVIGGTAPYDLVHRMIRRDGETIHVHAHGEVMRDKHGNALRMLGTVVDITERVRAEQELREMDRRRRDFLGVLSHELRNPLAVIRSCLHVVDRAAPGAAQFRRAIAVVDRQATHLARLVDDLLDVTRISSGKIRLQRERIDLVELVHHTVEDHRALLATRELVLELPDEPAWMLGDATRLAQVLGNVLSNAAKFTPEGGQIAVSLETLCGRAVLEVADTGLGIDREALGQLFVPFAQANRSVDRSPGGLGLGLALVKTLVEMHGGDVAVHSDGPGLGACITLRLPLVEPDGMTRRPPVARVATERRRILVIEDNRDAAEWLAEALTLSGHEVTVTFDGSAGLVKARELGPDVILCDIGLPGAVDGYAVARALQDDPALATALRVALTGYAQPEDQSRALEAGFDAHLAKPPDLAGLERLIAERPQRR